MVLSSRNHEAGDRIKELKLTITGRVQGVFYRVTISKLAKQLGLVGYTRNVPDGAVEVVAQGPKQHLAQLLKQCYDGPKLAQVDQINVDWREPTESFDTFVIK